MKRPIRLALLCCLAVLSCVKQDNTYLTPEWGELSSRAGSSFADLSCSLKSSYGIVDVQVLINDGTLEITHPAELDGNIIVASVSNLRPNTEYSFRFSISNGVYVKISPSATFSTGASPYIDIPDPNFRKYILENFDIDNDGYISQYEANRVSIIDVQTNDIETVSGLEYFENLTELYLNGSSTGERSGRLTQLDLSWNKKLQKLDCSRNNISEIDLSHNPELKELSIYECRLNSLDVSHNPELIHLTCYSNLLTSLDLAANDNLTILDACNNRLSAIDLSNLCLLRYCNLCDNSLETLDASSLIYAEYILCGTDKLKEVFLPNYSSALKELVLDCNSLTECPDLQTFPNLEKLYLFQNHIQSIDVSHNPKLEELRCAQNTLYYLFLAENQDIDGITRERSEEFISNDTELIRYGKEITVSDPEFKRILLEEHDYNNDGIFTISDALNITELTLFTGNVHSMAELRYFVNLERLLCYGDGTFNYQTESGKLTELDVTRCPKLIELCIRANNFTSVPNLNNNTKLEYVDLGHNQIGGTVNLNFLPKLKILHVGCNKIKRLNISSCSELLHITLHYNQLESVPNLSKNTKLISLYMENAMPANFVAPKNYLSNLIDLEELSITGFIGSELDFSNNKKLRIIQMRDMTNMKEADLRYSPNLQSIDAKSESRSLEKIYVNSSAPLDEGVSINDNTMIIRIDN